MARLGTHYALQLQSFMEALLSGGCGPVGFILDEFTNAPLQAFANLSRKARAELMSRLAKEIQETFDLEKLRLEATQKLNADEWPAYEKLREDFDGRRNFAKHAYELEYDERLAMARTRLINKAGAKDHSFKPRWMGGDKFNKEAHRQIRQAYLNEHVRIDRDEAEELMHLIGSSEQTRKTPP